MQRNVELCVDSRVYRTLLTEEQWQKVRSLSGNRKPRLKANQIRLVPYGTSQGLTVLGSARCILKAQTGATITTMVYVVRGAKESLLGLKDGEALGIIKIQPDGHRQLEHAEAADTKIRRLDMVTNQDGAVEGGIVSGGQTQEQINQDMSALVGKFPKVFKGLGRATGVPDIHIEMDDSVPPVQQKQRQIPYQYKQKLKDHLGELIKEGVVTPLECTNGTGWIHNVVITAKKWSEDKIRMNLDTRPMKKAVKASHFYIPTPQELRHEFLGISHTMGSAQAEHPCHGHPCRQQ